MPDFEYSAIDAGGKKVEGSVRAASKKEALSGLAGKGIYPLRLRGVASAVGSEGEEKTPLRLFKRITRKETALFYRQLATLVGTGIPLLKSLNAVVDQCQNPRFRQVLVDIRDEVQRGSTLSAAMGRHPKLFSRMYISLVKVGEATGKLEMILEQMASFSERDLEFRSNVKTALTYPLFVLTFAFLSISFILMFIMPRILKPLQRLADALPWPTLVLIKFQHFLKSYGIFVLIGLILAFVLIRRYLQKPEARFKFDRIKISMPLIGQFLRKIAIGQFVRSLGVLAKGGVPIIEALEIVKDVVGNDVISASVSDSILKIKKGETIAAALAQTTQFPGMITQMISVGEETGKLGEVLLRVADSQDFELNSAVKRLNALFEPIIIIVVGVIIGFMVIAVLLPIMKISQFVG